MEPTQRATADDGSSESANGLAEALVAAQAAGAAHSTAPDTVQAARSVLAQQAEADRATAVRIFQKAVTQMRDLGWTPAPQTILDGRGITQMIIIVPYQPAGPSA